MASRSTSPSASTSLKDSSTLPPFAALPTASGLARGHVQASLAVWGLSEITETAALISSELVANAVTASARVPDGTRPRVIQVCLIADGNMLTIECWDQAPGIPVLRKADEFAESGRGLAIIDDLTNGCW